MGDYNYSDDGSAVGLFALFAILIPIFFVLAIATYVISSFFYMKIFEKAGVEGKWRAWVPVYNGLVAAKLGDVSPWVLLGAALISGVLSGILGGLGSLVVLAVGIMYSLRIGQKLGKDWPLLFLWLIPGVGGLIWLGIVAFSNNRWNPAIPPAPWANSFLADKTVWNGIPVQPSQPVAAAGYGAPHAAAPGYGAPQAPAPGSYAPPAPPAGGQTPPPTYPPAAGQTPPPPAPPAGPQV